MKNKIRPVYITLAFFMLKTFISSMNGDNYCADPGIPDNGMKNSSTYEIGKKIEFQCLPGYILLGSETRECLPDRKWSGIQAKCVESNKFETAQVLDNLVTVIAKLEAEQKKKTKKYHQSIGTSWHNAATLTMRKLLSVKNQERLVIYFAFADSISIGENNFWKSIEFAKSVVKRIGVSKDGTRTGALTFGHETELKFLPFWKESTEEVTDALDNIEKPSGWKTNSSALELIRDRMIPYTQGYLSKKGQKSIIFILTDGKSNFGKDSQQEAELLKQDGVEIYCIAIASSIPQDSSYKISFLNDAGSTNDLLFKVKNHALSWLGYRIANGIKGRLVLYFAFNVSENIRSNVEFSKAMVKGIGISGIGTRAGALTFNSEAELQFMPNAYKTTEEVLDALDKVEHTDGGKLDSSALAFIRDEMIPLTEVLLSEQQQKSIVFVFTNDKTKMSEDYQQEEESLKRSGVDVYYISIKSTSSTSHDSLHKIASENGAGSKEQHVFILPNYDALSWLSQKLIIGIKGYYQCGWELEDLVKQIYGGKVVGGRKTPEPWPWMAALYFTTSDSKNELGCGGTIIHENFILTAAHCLETNQGSIPEENIIVKLGLTDVNNETYLEVFKVEKYFVHEKYNPKFSYFDYDIALLQLEKPIVYSTYIRPICIPPMELPENSNLYKPGHYAVAIGWGHASVKGMQQITTITVDHLKEVMLPIQSRERCLRNVKQRYAIPSEKLFTERMICAGDGNGGNDTCDGDSGGPLMQSLESSEGNIYWTQIGITSWGSGCALRNTFGYYTDIQKLRSWITNIIGNEKLMNT